MSAKVVNPVKKGRKVKFDFYSTSLEERIHTEKYTWICLVCGREWLMRRDAQRCNHTDYIWYGTRRFKCLSKLSEHQLEKERSRRKITIK